MPANMIRAIRDRGRCASHASRFICHSAGGLFIGIPNGAKAGPRNRRELQQLTTDAVAALPRRAGYIAEAMKFHHQAKRYKFDEPFWA